MKTKYIIFLLIFILLGVIGGGYWYFSKKSNVEVTKKQNDTTNNSPFGSGGDTTSGGPGTQNDGEGKAINTDKAKTATSSAYFSLEYNTPKEDSRAAADIAAEAQSWAEQNGVTNINSAQAAADLGISRVTGCTGYSYAADYIKYSGNDLTSYVNQADDFTCGAHGSSVATVYTYTKDGTKIERLSQIYNPGIYDFLSKYARQKLPGILMSRDIDILDIQDMFDEGTASQEENFSTFYFSGASLYIIFGQYSIGPYVIGSTTLEVPLSQISQFKK